ncbi:MAG: MotA/TolQ/ExbB proton channel family protein [Aquificaceae bacterium]
MSLDLLHDVVFYAMALMFLASNYVIALKFLQLRKKPGLPDFERGFSWVSYFRGGLWWLDFSATTAPLIGLLGTIIALIEAFQKLSAKGLSGASEISSAIGFALVATAIGILLSLWNYFFYKLFNDRLNSYKESLRHQILKEL